MKNKILTGFFLMSTFLLSSCSANEKLLKEVTNTNAIDGYQYSKTDARRIIREIDRNIVNEQYTTNFKEEDMPTRTHRFTGDQQALYTESEAAMKQAKQDLLTTGKMKKYIGYYKIYSGNNIPDDAKAVETEHSIYTDGGIAHALGIYAGPGEVVDIYVPISYKNDMFKTTFDEFGNLEYTVNDSFLTFTIGVKTNSIMYDIPASHVFYDMPNRNVQYTGNEIFKYDDTVVLDDGERYFHGRIANPVGGPIYATSALSNTSVNFRTSGALEGIYYQHGTTTNEEWSRIVKEAPGQYCDFVTHLARLSGPATDQIRAIKKIEEAGYIWDNIGNISSYFNERNYVVQIYDSYIAKGSALAYINRWFSTLPVGWMSGALSYDNLMNNGQWGDIHEYNHHFDYGSGRPNINWGTFNIGQGGEIGNNVINSVEYSLLTNIAKNRTDAVVNGGLEGGKKSADPYSNLYELLQKKYTNTTFSDFSEMYTAIFHSIGYQALVDTQAYDLGTANPAYSSNADFLYKNITQKTGLDFADYITDTLHLNITEAAKQWVKDLKWQDSKGNDVDYQFPSFAATASIYTKSNERVQDINQWRKDIKKNVKANGIPSYYNEEETRNNQMVNTGYTQKNLATNALIRNLEQTITSSYKRIEGGRNYVVNANYESNLDFNFAVDSQTHTPQGRLISSADIESVNLEWQEGKAISDNGDNTYTYNPKKADDEYDFAVSVTYKDKSYPTEILYGTLEKNGSMLTSNTLDVSGDTSNLNTILTNNSYDYDKITKSYKSIAKSNVADTQIKSQKLGDSKKTLTVLPFDVIGTSDQDFEISIYGASEVSLVEKYGKQYNQVIASDGKAHKKYEELPTIKITTKPGERKTYYLYSLNEGVQSGSAYLGWRTMSFGEEGNGDITIPKSRISSCGLDNRRSAGAEDFTFISGNNVANIGMNPFDTANEIRPISIKDNFTKNDTGFTKTNTYSYKDAPIIGFGTYNKNSVPTKEDESNSLTADSTKFTWQTANTAKTYDERVQVEKNAKSLNDGNYMPYKIPGGNNTFSFGPWTGISYKNFDNDYGAVYFTIHNKTKNKISDVLIQNARGDTNYPEAPWANPYYEKYTLVGDVEVYAGNSINDDLTPDLSKYKLVASSNIDGVTWKSFNERNTEVNRYVTLDKPNDSEYFVVKIKSSHASWGGIDAEGKKTKDEINIGELKLVTNFEETAQRYSFFSEGLKFNGDWKYVLNGRGLNGISYQGNAGAEIEFTFAGSLFELYGRTGSHYGKFTLTIDNKKYDIDTNSSSTLDNQRLALFTLKEGTHKVKIQVHENSKVILTSFNIIPGNSSNAGVIAITFFATFFGTIALCVGFYYLFKWLKNSGKLDKMKEAVSKKKEDIKNKSKEKRSKTNDDSDNDKKDIKSIKNKSETGSEVKEPKALKSGTESKENKPATKKSASTKPSEKTESKTSKKSTSSKGKKNETTKD